LLATTHVIDRAIGHADAEDHDLPALRKVVGPLGFDDEQLDASVDVVEAAYARDRWRGLVAAAFPELDAEGAE